jgi:hypothetical protein
MKKILDVPGMTLSIEDIRAMSAQEVSENIDLVNRSMRAVSGHPPSVRNLELKSLDDVRALSAQEIAKNLTVVNDFVHSWSKEHT